MSAPATKAFGPAPVSTTTRTSGSAAASLKAPCKGLQGRGVEGVELSGRWTVTVRMAPSSEDSDQGIGHGKLLKR